MNIGFVNIYPWRPHGFHAAYLQYQCNLLGYSTYFLECGGSFNECVCSKLNHRLGIIQCIQCQIGRASKYNNSEVFKINSKIPKDRLSQNDIIQSLLSTAIKHHREEVDFDYFSNHKIARSIDKLTDSYLKTYYSTLDFIDKKNLQSLIVFNGRIDVTRAAIDAAKFAKINFITHERPFMGHGIQIHVNENVIGLKDRVVINSKFDDKPLTNRQSHLAGIEIAKRFLGKNSFEWRVYNLDSKKLLRWPTSTNNLKILIVPSSVSERYGHEDWITPWKLATDGFDLFLKSIGAKKDQVIVRFHPNWIQKRGKKTGHSSHELYKTWCQNNSYHYIDCNEKISTMDLIDKCDVLVVNGSTAAIEGGSLGKKIVNIGPSGFIGAGFCEFLETEESINKFKGFENWISKEQIIRKTLRYVYNALARLPQYVDYVRALSTTECVAFKGADPERLGRIIKTGNLEADDDEVGSDDDENEVLNLIIDRSWEKFLDFSSIQPTTKDQLYLSRRFPFDKIDQIRKLIKRGDL
jgi:hypothetical protein